MRILPDILISIPIEAECRQDHRVAATLRVALAGLLFFFGVFSNGLAQENDRSSRPPERPSGERSFGHIMHEVRRQVFSSRIDFMALLSHAQVREEVGLDDAEFQAISVSNRRLLEEIREMLQADFETRQPPSEQQPSEQQPSEQQPDSLDVSAKPKLDKTKLISTIAELVRQSENQFLEELRADIDYDRFIQILIQARGNRAVVHEDVASRLGLDASKLQEVRSVSHQCWREQWESMGDKMRELMRSEENPTSKSPGKRKEARQLVERAEMTVDEALALRLSSEQLERLKELRGEPFSMPDDIFEMRLPGWGGRPGPKGHGDRPDGSRSDGDRIKGKGSGEGGPRRPSN